MTEGRIARWVVAPGTRFAAGDVIVEIETDKIVNEVEAPSAGTLLDLIEPEGATTPVGAPIARWRPESSGGEQPPRAEKAAPAAAEPGPPTTPTPTPAPGWQIGGARVLSTPYARKLAKEAGIDIGTLQGTGPRGRIKAADVERARTPPQVPAVRAGAAPPASARDLSLATVSVDAGRLREIERSLSRMQAGVRRLHCVALACVRALAIGEDMGDTVPIGLATDPQAWARPPTLLAHPRTTISALAAQAADLEARAGQGHLRQEETEGGRLLILAGNEAAGVFGPAAPPGWDAALGVGAEREVFRPGPDRSPALGHEMTLALSYAASQTSHASALDLLARIKELLDEPLSMLA